MPFSTNSDLPYPRPSAYPCTLNFVNIKFLPLDIDATPIDPDFRQAIRVKARKEYVVIKGQVNFGTNQKKLFNALVQSNSIAWNTTGDLAESIGHLVFRRRELYLKKFMPKKGDIVVGFGDYLPPEGMELLVESVRPESFKKGVAQLFYVELRSNRNKR